jgi:hypothetical protein
MPTRGVPRPRTTSKLGCLPLKEMYERAVSSKPKTWNEIEHDFLRAMERFDANVAAGAADIGDLQNGKGDFFNDLLALLLENCAGVTAFPTGLPIPLPHRNAWRCPSSQRSPHAVFVVSIGASWGRW